MEWKNLKVTVERKTSFVYFIYPFLFEGNDFENLVTAIEKAHLPGRNQKIWREELFCQEDLLFNVANYLNSSDELSLNCKLWKLNEEVRDTFGLRANWQLLSPQAEIPFEFGEAGQGNKAVQLALFRIGVGFLILRTQPKSNDLKDWLNFLHYFRFLRGQQGTGVKAQRRIGLNSETQEPEFIQFFPEVAGGVEQYKNSDRCLFYELITAFLKTGSNENDSQQWWREVFVPGQMLPFFALFVNELPAGYNSYLLYKLHNFFHIGQGNHPSREDLQPDNPALLSYTKHQWFIFSLEGGGFLGVDAPQTDFFQQTLPSHLRDKYFLLFLLALHQKFTLMMLSEKVAANWRISDDVATDVEHNTKVFTNIRNQLLLFTARGYFTQVMQREHYHRCYRKWQEVFQLERLYGELNDEVREMHEYSLMQLLRRQDEAAKERDRQRQEEIRQQDEAAKVRDRQRQEEIRRQDEAAKERDRLYLLALREKEAADKQREQLYLQELRAKDEAAQKRDRQLQNTVYIVSAGLGAGGIVASTAGLITQGSSDGQVTIKLPFTSSSLHPFSLAVVLSVVSALAFGGTVWGLRKAIEWKRDKEAQKKLKAFIKLLSNKQDLLLPQQRQNLANLVIYLPQDAGELWEAIANWCKDEGGTRNILGQLAKVPKSLPGSNDSSLDKNYKKMLLDALGFPNQAHKKVEAFIRLLTARKELFSDSDWENLRQEAANWPESVQQLADAIGLWCTVEGHSQIYTELLQLQSKLPTNYLFSKDGNFKEMLVNLLNGKRS
ncbi:hypothetical protein [Floridanema evergladense]|uniref:Uncharacterized protein n=1 Tax=Floridaenema evergladense BLCC-F167 TaxID=3153639 RepID=A0ABV4WD56_9CYAN